MKRQIVFLLSILFVLGAIPFQKELSQVGPVIELKVGERTLRLSESAIRKRAINQPVTSRAPAGTKTGSATSGKMPVDPREGVERLVKEFELDRKTAQNPHLAFTGSEIADWVKQHRNETDLRYEFSARQIVLKAADEQYVPIRDQAMLTLAARDVISWLKGGPLPPEPSETTCEGDTSQEKIEKAWAGLNAHKGAMDEKNLEQALVCTMSIIDRWRNQADEQQARRQQAGECRTTPVVSQKDAYFASYWALADVGTAWFIRGQALSLQRRWPEAREAYKIVIDRYSCAYTWDPKGYFWKTADGAQEQYTKIQSK